MKSTVGFCLFWVLALALCLFGTACQCEEIVFEHGNGNLNKDSIVEDDHFIYKKTSFPNIMIDGIGDLYAEAVGPSGDTIFVTNGNAAFIYKVDAGRAERINILANPNDFEIRSNYFFSRNGRYIALLVGRSPGGNYLDPIEGDLWGRKSLEEMIDSGDINIFVYDIEDELVYPFSTSSEWKNHLKRTAIIANEHGQAQVANIFLQLSDDGSTIVYALTGSEAMGLSSDSFGLLFSFNKDSDKILSQELLVDSLVPGGSSFDDTPFFAMSGDGGMVVTESCIINFHDGKSSRLLGDFIPTSMSKNGKVFAGDEVVDDDFTRGVIIDAGNDASTEITVTPGVKRQGMHNILLSSGGKRAVFQRPLIGSRIVLPNQAYSAAVSVHYADLQTGEILQVGEALQEKYDSIFLRSDCSRGYFPSGSLMSLSGKHFGLNAVDEEGNIDFFVVERK